MTSPSYIARALGAVLLATLLWPVITEASSIQRIRSASGDDFTRVVIDVSGSTKYRYGIVPAGAAGRDMPRLYIDLDGVNVAASNELGKSVGDKRVGKIRAAQHSGGTARVVLDLLRPVRANVFALQSPPRIVIDLTDDKTPQLASRSAATAKARPTAQRPARPARRPRIVIDAGHGGKDPGARGYKGIKEKDVVLDISNRVADKLKRRMSVDVYLTRTNDKFVPLDKRKDLANRIEADVFISIHANASRNSKLHGIETYYLKNTNDRATLRLAKLENGIGGLMKGRDVSTDSDLPYILSDMVQGQKEADSIVLANHIQDQLVGYLKPRYHSVENLGVKQGPFLVLDGTYMPSVLVETSFLTNALEGKRSNSASYREAVAEGIYRGVKRYLEDDRITASLH